MVNNYTSVRVVAYPTLVNRCGPTEMLRLEFVVLSECGYLLLHIVNSISKTEAKLKFISYIAKIRLLFILAEFPSTCSRHANSSGMVGY